MLSPDTLSGQEFSSHIFLDKKQKHRPKDGALFFVVKVRRVELLSESISTRLSPSAANVLFVSPLIAPVSRLYRWLAYWSPELLGAHTEFSCIIDARFHTYR